MIAVQDSVCLDNGAYYQNFAGCAECSGIDVLQNVNREKIVEDDQETITYEREWLLLQMLLTIDSVLAALFMLQQ